MFEEGNWNFNWRLLVVLEVNFSEEGNTDHKMECLVVGSVQNIGESFNILSRIASTFGVTWNSLGVKYISEQDHNFRQVIKDFVTAPTSFKGEEKVLLFFCHSEYVLDDRIFFDKPSPSSIFGYCLLSDIIDAYWNESHLKTLYVWNFCCKSQNADVVCATANYRHLRESNVDRYGIKMRSLVFDKNIPITILLIRGVLQYYEEASALQGHFKATTLFSNAEEEARMSHILGYDEKSPAGYLTPPVNFVTDRRIKGVLGLL